MNSTTSTVPGRQTRPRSLRPRSTSITCSDRSLGSASSSSCEPDVVLGGLATGPGPGDRVGDGLLAGDSHQRLGRAADDRVRRPVRGGQPEQVHVRARVRRAQDPVDLERVGRAVEGEALREDDLEHLSRADVLLGELDDRPVALGARVGPDPAQRLLGPRDVDDGHRAGRGGGQGGRHRVEAGDGVGPRRLDPVVGVVVVDGVGHEQDGAVGVVEHGEVGGEDHRELGKAELVGQVGGDPLPAAGRRRRRSRRPCRRSAAGARRSAGSRVPPSSRAGRPWRGPRWGPRPAARRSSGPGRPSR